jgi:DNA-3-methyladenine glycosylase
MYDMFNIVGREAGAVLVRAAAIGDDPKLGAGPGKLTRALGITVAQHNGIDLTESRELFIADARRTGDVATGPRIGVDYAGEWAEEPLRFWLDGHPAVSRAR